MYHRHSASLLKYSNAIFIYCSTATVYPWYPHLEEVTVELRRDGPGEQRLACTGSPVQQATLGRRDAHALEQLRIKQG